MKNILNAKIFDILMWHWYLKPDTWSLATWSLAPGTRHLAPGAWHLEPGPWHLCTWHQVPEPLEPVHLAPAIWTCPSLSFSIMKWNIDVLLGFARNQSVVPRPYTAGARQYINNTLIPKGWLCIFNLTSSLKAKSLCSMYCTYFPFVKVSSLTLLLLASIVWSFSLGTVLKKFLGGELKSFLNELVFHFLATYIYCKSVTSSIFKKGSAWCKRVYSVFIFNPHEYVKP